ncbi:MAG: nitroreductase family protein [Candidatus Nanohaloarchaea archaeon]|nr:nitroreductase family protein [Candidatus Nanohaloarchaea archaeon]
MNVLEAITTRASITRYEDEGVDREQVARLLEAARWAPSAGNMQVAEYVIVEDDELLEKLSQYAHNQPHVREAPLAIVILADVEKAERQYEDRGELYALQETAAAMQNILLEAHEQDLGAAWVGAFDEEQVSTLLHVPDRLRPVAIVTVGHPAERAEQPNKYDITSIAYLDRYGERVHPMYEKIVWRGLRHYGKKLRRKAENVLS